MIAINNDKPKDRVFCPLESDRGRHDVVIRWEMSAGGLRYNIHYWTRTGSMTPGESNEITQESFFKIQNVKPSTEIMFNITAISNNEKTRDRKQFISRL